MAGSKKEGLTSKGFAEHQQPSGEEKSKYNVGMDKIYTPYGRIPAWWVWMIELRRIIPNLKSRDIGELVGKTTETVRNTWSKIQKKMPDLLDPDPDNRVFPPWLQRNIIDRGYMTLDELRALLDMNSFVPEYTQVRNAERVKNHLQSIEDPDFLPPGLETRFRESVRFAERVREEEKAITGKDLLQVARIAAVEMLTDEETNQRLKVDLIKDINRSMQGEQLNKPQGSGAGSEVMKKVQQRLVSPPPPEPAEDRNDLKNGSQSKKQ